MDVKIENAGPCKKKVRIELPADRVGEEFEKNYREVSESLVLPGFRKGKAPRRLMQRRFGKHIAEQVRANLVTKSLEDLVEKHDLHPILDPQIDVEKIEVQADRPLVLEFEVEVRPEFELGPYTGIEVARHPVELSAADEDAALASLRQRHAEEVTVEEDGVVQRGDHVLTDLTMTGSACGEDAESGESRTEENFTIAILSEEEEKSEAASRYYPPSAFLGKKRGDVAAGEFPGEEHGDHVHPPRRWEARIKEIKRFELPTLDDEFAGELDCASIEELRGKVREELRQRREREEDQAVEGRIAEILVDRHPFDLPETLVKVELEHRDERRRHALERFGISAEELEDKVGDRREEDRETLVRELRAAIILDRICEVEGLQVTEDEVEGRIERIAHSQRRWPNEVRTELERQGLLDELRRDLRIEKARRFLREKAEVTQKEGEGAAGTCRATGDGGRATETPNPEPRTPSPGRGGSSPPPDIETTPAPASEKSPPEKGGGPKKPASDKAAKEEKP